jgi:spoIIIJ-associated protein
VEWVEASGRTVEEATQRALEHLGVGEEDAEVQVLSEPKLGLFGRLRGEARVRARVRASPVRPKLDERRKGGPDRLRRRRSSATAGRSVEKSAGERLGSGADMSRQSVPVGEGHQDGETGQAGELSDSRLDPGWAGRQEAEMNEEPTLAAQAAIGTAFLEGLLERLGVDGTVRSAEVDERTVEISVDGEGLGPLIGRGGGTLVALQELTRTVVQRQTRTQNGRVVVDVCGYRERRQRALQDFVRAQVEQVRASGSERALEPMSSADRKAVHDLVNTIDGVGTRSEGEEPRRRVIIFPQAPDPAEE